MPHSPTTAHLLREFVRRYARAQRTSSACENGASTVECHVLTELSRHDELTQQCLVTRLGLDKGWISRAVDRLVTGGLVLKKIDQRDRRCARLNLTEQGRVRAEQLEQTLNLHAQQVLNALPPQERAEIHRALESLVHALEPNQREE